MEQRIHALSNEELSRLEAQRTWVREHYERSAESRYATVEGKISLIATIVDKGWIAPHETVKLQSLGVAFGDALAQKLGLEWAAVEDEYGRDPALILKGTSIRVFPLTTIAKRIERGEPVDVPVLFENTCSTIIEIKQGEV